MLVDKTKMTDGEIVRVPKHNPQHMFNKWFIVKLWRHSLHRFTSKPLTLVCVYVVWLYRHTLFWNDWTYYTSTDITVGMFLFFYSDTKHTKHYDKYKSKKNRKRKMSTPLWLCCKNQHKARVQLTGGLLWRKEANPSKHRGWNKRKLPFTQKGSDPENRPNWLGRKCLMHKGWTDDREPFQAISDISSAQHRC